MRAASIITRRALVSSRGVRAAAPRQLAPWRCLTQTTAPGAQEKRDILKASVPHVASLGWCDDALAAGARDLGLSAAAQGQVTNGAVDLVAFVAQEQCDKLREEVDDAAEELAALDDWRDRLKLAISKRLELSKPFHAHRAQAMGLMVTPLARDDGAVPPADPPPAFEVLHRLVDELARATVVHEELDVPEWRLRRAAAGVAYALCEVRALTDDSEDLGKSLKVAAEVVDRFGDASEGPAALKQGLKAGAHAAASLGTAALSFLPGPAVGALPQLLDVFASRLSGGLEDVFELSLKKAPGAARVARAGAAGARRVSGAGAGAGARAGAWWQVRCSEPLHDPSVRVTGGDPRSCRVAWRRFRLPLMLLSFDVSTRTSASLSQLDRPAAARALRPRAFVCASAVIL